MKRTILILSTLRTLSLSGMAQDKLDPYISGDVRNGRAWLAMSYVQKLAYLDRYKDQPRIADERLSKITVGGADRDVFKNCAEADIVVPYLINAEIAKGLNAFFDEPANENISIGVALAVLGISGLMHTMGLC
jgi:hypothetical protein